MYMCLLCPLSMFLNPFGVIYPPNCFQKRNIPPHSRISDLNGLTWLGVLKDPSKIARQYQMVSITSGGKLLEICYTIDS